MNLYALQRFNAAGHTQAGAGGVGSVETLGCCYFLEAVLDTGPVPRTATGGEATTTELVGEQ